ncbi:MAG: DegV family EDD domain-containing protein [Chloroflexi bacterium]|nr:DegV family EDD domain-containing protein [Chloroflexota bacterium]
MSIPSIVTDSTARFSIRGFLENHPVSIAPMTIRRGQNSFVEGEKNNPRDIDLLFTGDDTLPIAEPASREKFAALYDRLRKNTDQILSIHTSSLINPVAANAHAASQQYLGRCNIQVIDSQSFSVGLGLLVQAAAEAVAQGEKFEEIIRIVRGMIPRLYTIFSVDNLAYLEHNQMITRSQAILGSMLGVIALLTIEEGKIIPMEKVRTRSRAIEKMVEFSSEFSSVEHIAILQNSLRTADEARTLKDRLRALYRNTPITITEYGPSVATYVGPMSLGVVILEAEEE